MKIRIKGTCWICSDPACAYYNTKKYCKRCARLKKQGNFSEEELIKMLR